MANTTHELKSRLKSIQSTQKITKAMQLVAVSKLQKIKSTFLKNQQYAQGLREIMVEVLSANAGIEHRYMTHPKVDDKPFWIIFSSDLGLAGGYTSNIYKHVNELNPSGQSILWIGQKGYERYVSRNYQIENKEVILGDKITYQQLSDLSLGLIQRFEKKEITSIHILYTNYLNATSYEVIERQVLPVKLDQTKDTFKEIIYEPSAQEILDQLIPQYVVSEVYQYYMASKTSEYSARRVAMENATDNAQELLDDLTLQYNKLRQQAITQEITEIISGTIGG